MREAYNSFIPWIVSIHVSLAHSVLEPEVMSGLFVGFTRVLYQDFSNVFLNLWKAIGFLNAPWQGVSQFNYKLCQEPLYIAVINLAFASFISCPLVLMFRKAVNAHSWFTFPTALMISQPSVSAWASFQAGSICFPVMLQDIFIALIWTCPIPEKNRQRSHK